MRAIFLVSARSGPSFERFRHFERCPTICGRRLSHCCPFLRNGVPWAVGRESTLRFRVLRYATRKYHLAGQLFSLDDIPPGSAPAEIIRMLCRNLLGRIDRPDDLAAWLPALQGESPPEQSRLRTLVERIERSDEYSFLVKYAIYDLDHDPLEVKPVDPRRRASDWDAYRKQVEIMQSIDRQARPGEPLLTNEADEELGLRRIAFLE